MANTDMRRRLAMMLGDCQVTIKGVPPITTARRRLLSLKAFGGTEQNGTPTPDAPVDIVSNNGVVKLSNYRGNIPTTIDTTSSIFLDSIALNPEKTYTISFDVSADFSAQLLSSPNYLFSLRLNGTGRNNISIDTINAVAGTTYALTFSNRDLVRLNNSYNVSITSGSLTNFRITDGSVYADGTVEKINVHGKNLFDINSVAVLGVRYTLTVVGNNIEAVAGRNTNTASRISIFIPVSFFKENTTYYFNSKSDTSFNINRCTIGKSTPDSTADSYYYDTISQKENNGYSGSFTITDIAPDQEYVSIFYYLGEQDENTRITISDIQIEQGSTATAYEPYYNGGTATAEMLLKVGNLQDVQSILDGVVTRNVGVKVFDGTETITGHGTINGLVWMVNNNALADDTAIGICSHYNFTTAGIVPMPSGNFRFAMLGSNQRIVFKDTVHASGTGTTSANNFKAYLADQYAAGTPVIVVYPIATPATEQVSGQTLTLTNGTNVIDITQASLDNLELEVKVK